MSHNGSPHSGDMKCSARCIRSSIPPPFYGPFDISAIASKIILCKSLAMLLQGCSKPARARAHPPHSQAFIGCDSSNFGPLTTLEDAFSMKECRRRRFDTDSIAGRSPLTFHWCTYAASSYPPSPPRRYVAVPFVAFFEAAAAAPQFCFMVRRRGERRESILPQLHTKRTYRL